MVAPSKRYFMHHSVIAALPQRNRMALRGFMDELIRSSWEQDGGLYVDTTQGALAEACGVSVRTVQRREKDLIAAGLLRVARVGAPSRLLELLDPCADRAVDNSVENRERDGGHSDTGVVIIRPTVSPQNGLVLMSGKGSERSRQGRPEPGRQRKPSAAQTADARHVARGIVHSIAQRLGDAFDGQGDERPWKLGRRQTARVEDRITQRLEAINRGAVSDLAIDLTRRDVDRVVTYALASPKPAAYLYRSITGGDWRCDPAPGSQAAKVAAAGPRAEMPVSDLSSREGPPALVEPAASAKDRQALASILDATGAGAGVRAAAARVHSASGVRDLTARLTDAWMQTMAQREVIA